MTNGSIENIWRSLAGSNKKSWVAEMVSITPEHISSTMEGVIKGVAEDTPGGR